MQTVPQIFNFGAENIEKAVEAQAVDLQGVAQTPYFSTGIFEIGGGQYLTSFILPDGFIGALKARLTSDHSVVDSYPFPSGGQTTSSENTTGIGVPVHVDHSGVTEQALPFLPGTDLTVDVTLTSGQPFALDSTQPTTIAFHRIKSDGTAGAYIHGPFTGLTDITSPYTPLASTKLLSYRLPSAADDHALPYGDLVARVTVNIVELDPLIVDIPFRLVTTLTPLEVVVPPDSFNPWMTFDGTAQMGISGPTSAVFPYLYNPTQSATPGFPPIWASFSDVIDQNWLTTFESAPDARYLSVWRSQMLDYVGRVRVHGTWRIATADEVNIIDAPEGAGSSLIFDPAEAILPNNRYTVHIGRGLPFESGYFLEEGFEWHFMSKLFPFYSDPYSVRNKLGEYSGKVSDEQLYYSIWEASVDANRETMPYFGQSYYSGGPPAQTVLAWQPPRTLAFSQFTLVQSVINVTKGLLSTYLEQVSRKEQGLDFSTEVADGLIKNLQLSLKMLTQEREPYYSEISRRRNNVRTARQGSYWPGGQGGSNLGANDRSYRGRRKI